MPVSFSKRGDPLVSIEIENKPYLFTLDTGGWCYFAINNDVLDKIFEKKKIKDSVSYDFKGNKYTSSQFIISSVKMGKSTISHVPAMEESADFLLIGSAWYPEKMSEAAKKELTIRDGRVGVAVLRAFPYWLLDFPNSSLVFIKDLQKFKQRLGISLDDFTEVRLEDVMPHIVIAVETELGIKRFMLDTGSNRSILRYPPDISRNFNLFTFDRFEINGRNFDKMKFCLFEITPQLPCDGILGVDFFMQHQIYFDFEENKAYIGPTTAS